MAKIEKRLLALCICLFVLESCFVFAPMRLGVDSIRYFQMAIPAALGGNYGNDQFPPFFPHFLCWLMKLGICSNVLIVGCNFMAFGVSVWLTSRILRLSGMAQRDVLVAVLCSVACHGLFAYIVCPLSDAFFMVPFLACILGLMHYTNVVTWKRWIWLAGSVLFAGLALSIRTAALPLFGVIILVVAGLSGKSQVSRLVKKRSFWIVFGGGILLFFASFVLACLFGNLAAEGGYLSNMILFYKESGVNGALQYIHAHVIELGRIGMNSCTVKPAVMRIAVYPMSILVIVSFVMMRRCVHFIVFMAMFFYGLFIFVWPYSDVRFWIPIAPFGLAMVYLRVKRFSPILGKCFVSLYVLMGLVYIGYYGQQWSKGCMFTPDASLSDSYYWAYNKPVASLGEQEKTKAVFFLKMFDRRHACTDALEELTLGDFFKYQRHSFRK